ncbi:MAG TPA: hypothetical protein VGC84_17835, partial [Ilumatobacteraceae bacterium]
QGAHPSVLGRKHVPWDLDVTISCGGATVQPGDIIVGDGEGAVVIPPSLVVELAAASVQQEAEESWALERVDAGESTTGVFPVSKDRRAEFEAWHAKQGG